MASEPSHAQPGRWIAGQSALPYKLYVPSKYDAAKPAPLVVMLHGCTQDPDDFARGSRMNAAAEERTVLLLYPQQTEQKNPKKCWNWFDAAHQRRDAGEPAAIVATLRDATRQYAVDPGRVYAYGISAGGAMAVILAAAYPDVFAAVGSHSGLAYGAASNVMEALAAMQRGAPDVKAAAAAAHLAMGAHARTMPVIIIHGDRDAVANVANARQTAEQWLETNALARGEKLAAGPQATVTATHRKEGRYPVSATSYADGKGRVMIELWIVQGLGHALSGGDPSGTFTDPKGPDTSGPVLRFLLDHPMTSRSRR